MQAPAGAEMAAAMERMKDLGVLMGSIFTELLNIIIHDVQEPAGAEMAAAMERMKDLGVLMGKGGLHGSCFRIMCAPDRSMCIAPLDLECSGRLIMPYSRAVPLCWRRLRRQLYCMQLCATCTLKVLNPGNRCRPPMCFSIEDADFLVDVMDTALSEL